MFAICPAKHEQTHQPTKMASNVLLLCVCLPFPNYLLRSDMAKNLVVFVFFFFSSFGLV